MVSTEAPSEGAEELADASRRRTLRRLNGCVAVTDGPFAEVREVIGGLVILDVPGMADAERIAAEWPGVANWCARIELRPLAAAAHMAPGGASGVEAPS